MYARKYGKRFGRRKTMRKRMYKRRPKVSKVVKRYVKKAIHRSVENKTRVIYAANQSVICGDYNTMTWPLINAVSQGSNAESRIGNEIRVVKGVWKMAVNLLPYDATYNLKPLPCWVKIWVVKDLKVNQQLSSIDSASFAAFFRYGGGVAAFQNNTLDIVGEVNTDNFRVLYSRTFKLGISSPYQGGGLPTLVQGWNDNSPFAKQISIPWGKWCKKGLKFQDNASYAMNNNLYVVIQAVPCDGSSVTANKLIEFHYTNQMHYEDA